MNFMLAAGLFAMKVLEVMFFIGMIGSATIVLTTCIRTIFHSLFKSEPVA